MLPLRIPVEKVTDAEALDGDEGYADIPEFRRGTMDPAFRPRA